MHREDGIKAIKASSSDEWRNWLSQNHNHEKNVWLIIFHKDSGIPSVTYDQAVDEALCFGWVDSKPNKRDGQSYFQFFAARNPKSNWSKVNKEKVHRLIESGRMAPAGLDLVQEAKTNGSWTALDAVERLEVPADLQAAFDQNNTAFSYWNEFPKSSKRGILEWIFNAKRPETRQKRILETVEMAQRNERANHYRQPKKK